MWSFCIFPLKKNNPGFLTKSGETVFGGSYKKKFQVLIFAFFTSEICKGFKLVLGEFVFNLLHNRGVTESWRGRIMEWFELEGILKLVSFHPCCEQGHLPLPQVAPSAIPPGLGHFQGLGSHSTAFLGNNRLVLFCFFKPALAVQHPWDVQASLCIILHGGRRVSSHVSSFVSCLPLAGSPQPAADSPLSNKSTGRNDNCATF